MKKVVFISLAIALILIIAAVALHALTDQSKSASAPIPRYVSLRNNEANMRTGPGTRYPIAWVYKHQGLPVEVIAKDDDDIWRRVRDQDGASGWIHKSELSGKRGAIVTGGVRDLRASRDDNAAITAHLESGAVGQLLFCDHDWCKLKFEGVRGYLRKDQFWGAYPDESFD